MDLNSGFSGNALAARIVWYKVHEALGWVMRGNTPDAPSQGHLLEQSGCHQFLTRTRIRATIDMRGYIHLQI
jgi:hypothetical protein